VEANEEYNGNGTARRDKFFLRVLIVFGAIMLGFGAAATILAIWGDASDQIILRVVNAMGSMFTGMLGLAVGYLGGRSS